VRELIRNQGHIYGGQYLVTTGGHGLTIEMEMVNLQLNGFLAFQCRHNIVRDEIKAFVEKMPENINNRVV